MSAPRIALISDRRGWHCRQLTRAFARRRVAVRRVALQDCRFALDREPGIVLPGFETELPEAVFVRGVPAGTFEQVTFWLDILHGLRGLGVLVYNDARMIERSVDKAMTSLILRRAGIATPPCWVSADPARAAEIVRGEAARGHELVCKPLFGSQGEGLVRVGAVEALPPPDAVNGVYYLQRFVPRHGDRWLDWRVFVIGGHAVAAMQRSSDHWITNFATGADCHPALLNAPLRQLAEAAAQAVDLYYGGVDILCDDAGQYSVLEVNSVPAWQGLQSTCGFNIAERLVADFLVRIGGAEIREVRA
ncbi:MAG: RimK family alpha-L-glutamate ligase [Thiotrichales bacterium]